MVYQPGTPGDWGQMQGTADIVIAQEELSTADSTRLFLRSWKTESADVLLILHGLGGHSGWYIDMGNVLASHGITVYAMDHRGFGRSGGLAGHIADYHTYLKDIECIVAEIRKRHPQARIFLLGHSMGGLFAAHFGATFGNMLAGAILLNPWIQDTSHLSLLTSLSIVLGGLFKSKRYYQVAGGTEVMTTNPEAIQMLQADPLWRRKQTASMLFQVLLMRLIAFRKARRFRIPALILQAEADKSVIIGTNRRFFESLDSSDKVWKTYPHYSHDSEFEQDRSQLDHDLITWILEHSATSK